MSRVEKKALPEFQTDDEAERFIDEADLSQFDLQTNRRMVRLDFVKPEAARFEVFTDDDGQFRFRLRDEHGDILLLSEAYGSKEAVIKVIDALKSGVIDTQAETRTPPKAIAK